MSPPEFFPMIPCESCGEDYTVYDDLRDPARCYRCVRLWPFGTPKDRP